MGSIDSIDLPRLRVDLLELELVSRDNFTALVKDQEARAGGALVNGSHEGDVGVSVDVNHCVVNFGDEGRKHSRTRKK